MRFSDQFLEEIRQRVPISDVVGRRVQFDRRKSQPSKGDFWGCCPFHGEKTPSFHCEDSKGRYYCFGCQASGDHFRFMTELDGVPFPEAVERLADEAGLELPAPDPQAAAKAKARATLHDVMAMAADWYEQQLQTADGAKARAYLRDRGLSAAVQKRFRMGYAPAGRSRLKEYLAGKGIEPELVEACGMVVHGSDIPVSYDRFRDRVMFPIEDPRGRVIAFGGRALSPDVPAKYLNSPETELFSKGRVLYNQGPARKAVADDAPVIAVEGYMDVISLGAFGFDQAVAPLGTALTENQLALLWRISDEPVLCFDGDGAGLRAAHRAVDLALERLEPGKSVRFALLPEGQDPDDLLRARGKDAMSEVLGAARPLADMVWSRETAAGTFETPERRAALERRFGEIARSIANEDVRRHYAQDFRERLAGFLGTGKPKARDGYKAKGFGQGQRGYAPPGAGARMPVSDLLASSALVRRRAEPPLREAMIVGTILNHPGIGLDRYDTFAAVELDHDAMRGVRSALIDWFSGWSSAEAPTVREVDEHLVACGLGGIAEGVRLQLRNSRIWQALPDADHEDAASGWVQALGLHARARSLLAELKAAEAALETDATDEAYDRFTRIKQELANESATEVLIEGFGARSGRPERSL